MGEQLINDVLITRQKVIPVEGGNVMHGIKAFDTGYEGFGEAYFSMAEHGAVKGWKRHREMTLNLLVPVGTIRFVLFDDRPESQSNGSFQEIILSLENYNRLTVPPMIWMAFQGINSETSLLLNVASIPHDPDEADKKGLDEIEFDWSIS